MVPRAQNRAEGRGGTGVFLVVGGAVGAVPFAVAGLGRSGGRRRGGPGLRVGGVGKLQGPANGLAKVAVALMAAVTPSWRKMAVFSGLDTMHSWMRMPRNFLATWQMAKLSASRPVRATMASNPATPASSSTASFMPLPQITVPSWRLERYSQKRRSSLMATTVSTVSAKAPIR